MKVITLKLRIDDGEALKSIDDLGEGLANLDQISARQATNSIDNLFVKTDVKARAIDRDLKNALSDISRMQKERVQMQINTDKLIQASETVTANNRIKEAKRSANALIAELEKIKKENEKLSKPPSGNGSFDVFVGSLASRAFTEAIGLATRLTSGMADLTVQAVKVGAEFEQTRNSLIVFSGSAERADRELAAIDETARNTAGLRLVSAEQGYKQLRALGFEADNSRKLIAGLGKERLLSGAQENDVQRVIVNLTQLSAGSSRASQDIKEIYHSMPSLRKEFALAFGTLDPQKIAKMFDKDAQGAIAKLTDQLEKAKGANGGLSDSWGKLEDQIITAEREFSKPILQPLTDFVKNLTGELNKNKSSWQEWGQYVGDIIEGFNQKQSAKFEDLPIVDNNPNMRRLPNGQTIMRNGGLSQEDPLETLRKSGELARKFKDSFNTYPDFLRSDNTFNPDFRQTANIPKHSNFGIAKSVYGWKTEEEQIQEEFKKLQEAEKARKDELERVDSFFSNLSNIRENAFSLELAKVKDNAEATNSLTIENYKSQISETVKFYNQKISLAENDNDIYKLEVEKGNKIRDLNTKQAIEQINFEREQNAKRRQNYLEFKELQEKEFSAFYDKQAFFIERGLEKGVISTAQGYDQLIEITKNRTNSLIEVTKDEYATKLADSKLNAQEIINLTKERDLKLADLAEQSSRNILSIEDNRYQKSLELIDKAFSQRRDLISSYADSTQFGIGLLSPDSFGINSASLIQRALTGSDLATLENSTKTALEKARLKIQQNLQSAEIDLNTARTSGNKDGVVLQSQRVREFSDALTENSDNLKNWGNLIDENVLKVNQLVEKIKSGNGTIQDFDTVGLEALKLRQQRESQLLDEEIASYDKRIKLAVDASNKVDAEAFTYQKLNLERRKTLKGIQDEAEQNKYLSQTIEGLTDALNKLRSGDKVTVDLVKNSAQRQILNEQKSLLEDNIFLQERLAHVGEDSADRYKNAWLSATIEVKNANIEAMEEIIRANVRLDDSNNIHTTQIKARILQHLAEQKTISETIADSIINVYEKTGNAIDKLLDKSGIGKVPIIGDIAKGLSRNFLTNITRGLLDKFLPSEITDKLTSTGNPVLDENVKQTNYLKDIRNAVTGKGIVSGSGTTSGGFGNIINSIKQVFGLGGNTSTPSFNPNSSGNFFANNPAGLSQIQPTLRQIWDVPNSGLTKQSGGFGSIFGKEGFGNNVGTYSAIGMGANIIGGLIGGRVGGFLSGAGTGMAMGAQIGTMIMPGIGTAIGAVAGAIGGGLLSLFGGDKNRKQDKKENMPALQKGLTDSFTQFQQLLTDLKSLRIDGGSAITKARELRNEIANGFNINFLSKKYKKESQKLISLKLAEIDRRNEQDPLQGGLMQQIEYYAELAKGAENRNKRIVAEFATGVYISPHFKAQYSDFKKRNGILQGSWTGRDELLSVLAKGEMVLNPRQIRQVIQNARSSQDDPFKNANIPGYADGVYVSPSPKTSPSASSSLFPSQPIILQPQFILRVEEGMTFDERTKVYLESDSGKRVQVDVQKTLKKEGKI